MECRLAATIKLRIWSLEFKLLAHPLTRMFGNFGGKYHRRAWWLSGPLACLEAT